MKIQEAIEIYKKTNDEQDLRVLLDLLKSYTYKELAKRPDKIEAKSDLNYVMYKAIENYNVSKSIKFITFFWRCWYNQLGKELAYKKTIKRNQGIRDFSMNIVLPDFEEELGTLIKSKTNELNRQMFHIQFSEILSKLNKKDAYIIRNLYEGFTIREIANAMSLSRQRVYERIMNFSQHRLGKELYEVLKDYIFEKTG